MAEDIYVSKTKDPCPRCKSSKVEPDGSLCTLCDGEGYLDTIRFGDTIVKVKRNAKFTG